MPPTRPKAEAPELASASARAAEVVGPALDRATLGRRARLGVLILIGRTVLQQLTVLGGTVYLARVLGPGEFGVFWIVQFALSFFALFGDAGFGAALIQKKDTSRAELSSVFWSQLLLALLVVAVVFAAAPWVVAVWPDLPANADWMLRALSLSLLFTSLRVIPAILLERELLFGRLSAIDLVLSVSFYGTAVLLAHLGYGTFALVGGVLVQGLAGLLIAFSLRPWLPGLVFDVEALRPILKFGIAFQAKHIIGFANAAVMPLYAGRALGRYPLGIVTWSQNTASFPLKIVDILSRVNFPLLSRLQHDKLAFARTLERTIHVCATVTYLFVALFLGLAPSLVQVIYGAKWLPALPTLYVFICAISVGFLVPIVNGALDAIGKPRVMMLLGLGWTLLNWIAVTVAMHLKGSAVSFAFGYCIHILFGNLAVVFVVKQLIPEARLWPRIRSAIASALATALVARWLLLPLAKGVLSLSGAVFAALAVFVAATALFDRSALIELLAMVRNRQISAKEAG